MRKVVDGNEAVAHVSYCFTEVAVLYPITPSSTMGEQIEVMSHQKGLLNGFGEKVKIIQMQSEGGVAGSMHGLLKMGALTTTYTSSQGLLLMEPTLFKLVGEALPGVIHVASRALASGSLSIFGDHSDVMAIRHIGMIILSSSSVQEAALFAAISHEVAYHARIPVLHFFDGFNTSHEQRSIELPSMDEIDKNIDRGRIHAFKKAAMRNDRPSASGSSLTPDIYFQQVESNNVLYESVADIVEEKLKKWNPVFSTSSRLIDYEGVENPETIIIAMGSVFSTLKQVVNELNQTNSRYGAMTIHLYRPFPGKQLLDILPIGIKNIVVLDRTKENGSVAEPLLSDILATCYNMTDSPRIIGGRYGLGSKDVTASQIRAAILEAERKHPMKKFTLGINDDVTNLSLKEVGEKDISRKGSCFQSKTWGMGADGAVSINRESIKIIGEQTELNVQGQFWFDSRKTDNLTVSDLRISKEPILSAYKVYYPNLVSCYNQRYLKKFNVLEGIQENGIFLLNVKSSYDLDHIELVLTDSIKRELAKKHIRFYVVPAGEIARKYQLGPKVNTIMQTCFFYLSNLLPFNTALEKLKNSIRKKYGQIDSKLVADNIRAMDDAISYLKEVEVLPEWSLLQESRQEKIINANIENFQQIVNSQKGDLIPVSAFVNSETSFGKMQTGTSKNEKSFVCDRIPDWNSDRCIQCNLCATVCPHAAIRPFILDGRDKHPFDTQVSRVNSEMSYRLQVSPKDCTGCGLCYDICPAKGKALEMVDVQNSVDQQETYWEYTLSKAKSLGRKETAKLKISDSQYNTPLFEFSSACAGCGETAYIKLITQLFGERMMIANATGCSSIYGASNFSIPYTTNENGYGPSWGTSLFENNAEYGYGMQIGSEILQENLSNKLRNYLSIDKYSKEFKSTIQSWLDAYEQNKHFEGVAQLVINAIINEKDIYPELNEVFDLRFLFVKRSQWIIGGDGWAYDIGYGGLDHILSTNVDVNVLILDTEGYSNTGGHTSKATPLGAKSKFASSGNKRRKKDLANILIQNESIYVAQVAIGANPEQTLKAIIEAEAYKGPSVIIAYSPCILHGLLHNSSVIEEKKAVDCGYWPLFRFYPGYEDKEARFYMDSKHVEWDQFDEFLKGERRYANHKTKDLLFELKADSIKRFKRYEDLAGKYSKGVKNFSSGLD